jgi:hypothetical protein
VPTLAGYSTGNLAAWQWPAGVQWLVIFADHAKAGRDAAHSLQARALRAWLRTDVVMPSIKRADWCDVWATGAAGALCAGAGA